VAGRARLSMSLHGTVQGVGFRWFARQQAQLLGCTGYARNDPSGTRLEVVAEGPREVLQELISRLRQGPSGARVTHVEAQWQETTGEFEQFQIRH
jgi:acylphosphatase